jgi:hypothetical protein
MQTNSSDEQREKAFSSMRWSFGLDVNAKLVSDADSEKHNSDRISMEARIQIDRSDKQ